MGSETLVGGAFNYLREIGTSRSAGLRRFATDSYDDIGFRVRGWLSQPDPPGNCRWPPFSFTTAWDTTAHVRGGGR
jgi:hypothetical protein